MFEIQEDMHLEEGTFLCTACGCKNYYYFDEGHIWDRCHDCMAMMFPRPSKIRSSVIYRKLYHKIGKAYENVQETQGPKIYSCNYSPY